MVVDETSGARPSAFDVPEVRARVTRRQRRARRLLGVSAALTVIVCIGGLWVDRVYSDRQHELDRYPGRVVSVTPTPRRGNDTGTAEVSFITRWGAPRRYVVDVDDTSDWFAGQQTAVLVDPHHPTFVTLPGENYLPDWFGMLAIVAVLGVIGGVAGGVWLVRVRRLRTRLERSRWRVVEACGITVASDDSSIHVLFMIGPGGGSFWRCSRAIVGASPTPLEIAGTDRRLIVRQPGADKLATATRANMPSPRPARCRGFARREDELAIRLAVDDDELLVELVGELSKLDEAGMSSIIGSATVCRGPAGVVVLRLPGRDAPVIGIQASTRRARRWERAAAR
jgi:hypothetical protein